jgi:hypothetical protein
MQLNFASPEVAHVTWLNPTERFERALQREIARITHSWSQSTRRRQPLADKPERRRK